MPIDTSLNVSPYYDDFDEDKNFHRVLFRPTVAVQARELTQLQTILQNQIERFGDNIYRVGTIIKGCSFTTDYNYYYVKIRDNQADGQLVNMALYSNTLVVQESSSLQALVVNYKTGLESQDPDLNTLYVKYLNTGSGGEKTFANNELLTVYDRDRTVESITINNGGTSYSNADTVVIAGTGSGAQASLTTFANGTIKEITITEKGSGYTSTPTVTITTSTGSSANLAAVIYLAQLRVANGSFTAPVGIGTAIKTSEGIIYQKGHFIRVAQQEAILAKYTKVPDNIAVGFVVNESFVNSSIDTSLLDNSAGSTNFAAPGANRLKLTPQLSVISRSEAVSNTAFLSLLEYEGGNIVKNRTRTQFNSINDEVAKRTFEESGNYVVNPFPITTSAIASNTTHFDMVIGAGVAYVNGNRNEILNNAKIPVRKGTDFSNSAIQTISTSYGSYVLVDQLLGTFDIKTGSTVTLRNVAGTDVADNAGGTPTLPGAQIGTAKIRAIVYDSGTIGSPTAQYKLYLFDIRMATGFSFKNVRSVAASGTAVADIVLEAAEAVLKDIDNDVLVISSGTNAVKEFNNETFVFRTSSNGTIQTTGNLAISFSGGNTLPYGVGVLSTTNKQQFVVVPTTTLVSATNKTGTVTVNSTASNITGTSTLFTTEYQVGDYIKIGSKSPYRVVKIYNDVLMELNSAPGSATGNVHTVCYPSNVPIDFTRRGKVIQVTSTTGVTLSLGHTTTATGGVVVYHDLQNFEPAVKQKTVNGPVYVKLSTSSIRNSINGPWCIGIPDVYELVGVYLGSGATYANTSSTNYKDMFVLNSGQTDNMYGLASIYKKPGASVNITSNTNLLVSVRAFTHGSGKYISTESYPIDDTNSYDANTSIRTQDIPFYTSPTSTQTLSLRDALDFRPIVANTANLSTTAAGATIDPSASETLTAGEKFFPSPTRDFEATIQSFLNRVDRIIMEQDGNVKVVEGVPSNDPVAPPASKGSMDLGLLYIAPYPSLSAKEAADAKRPDLASSIRLSQNKRYTMKDISFMEDRLRRLEYYTSLSILEANTKNLTLASESNTSVERFKNGFFVDSFANYDISNLDDPEYNAFIDVGPGKLTPVKTITDVGLVYTSGAQRTNDLITLPYTSNTLISQPYANKERTLSEENWSYRGNMKVIPSFDNFFDTTTTATSAINVDIASPIQSLTKSINDALSKITIASSLLKTETTIGQDLNPDEFVSDRLVTTTNTFQDTKTRIKSALASTNTTEVGSFLTDFTLSPYIRAQKIAVFVAGLRPGATHHVYFDGASMDALCTPAAFKSSANLASATLDSVVQTGFRGGALVAANNGTITFIMNIPGGTFNTGEREILIMDVDNLDSEISATSKATGKFSSFNFNGEKTRVTFSTKSFDISPTNNFAADTYNVTRVAVTQSHLVEDIPRPDPLSQTFRVQPQVDGTDTLFLTSIDLFFKQKHPTLGVSLEIREVDSSGYPTQIILPFSKVYKYSSQVSTSATAATATTFTFDSPVAVTANRDYAIIIRADANSPDYRIWTAVTGKPDVADATKTSNESWGLGTMFYSVSGSVFTPVQNEDIKFLVRYAKFSSLSSSITMTNADQEFLSLANGIGTFTGGEDVAQLNSSYINTTITTSNTSNTITTSTNLSSSINTNDWVLVVYDTNRTTPGNVSITTTTVTNVSSFDMTASFTAGDFVAFGNSSVKEIRQVVDVANSTTMTLDAAPHNSWSNAFVYAVEPKFDVLQVLSANSTALVVNKYPRYTSNSSISTVIQKSVRGRVSFYDGSADKLHIKDSTSSNSGFKILTSNSSYLASVVGGDSDARARVSSIDDIALSSFKPLINYMALKGTTVTVNGSFIDDANNSYTQSLSLNRDNTFDLNGQIIVKSKSNEIVGTSINKSLSLTLGLASGASDTSPVIDVNPSSLVGLSYVINNDATDENTRHGNASAKYISKRLTLADGLDAEDVKVFVAGYKPVGTDIKVYAKVINAADGDLFDNKAWSELVQTSPNIFSASLDRTDLREYEFTFKNSPSSYTLPGVIESFSNSTIDGSNVMFTYAFNSNSAVNESTDFITITDNKFVDGDILTYVVDSGNTVMTSLSKLQGYEVQSASVNAAGGGYTNGDIIYVSTGTGATARYLVTTGVSDSNVASVSALSRGLYSVAPTTSNSATVAESGGGTGATLNLTMRTLNGPFYVTEANTSGVKLSDTSGGSVIELVKGVTEGGHRLQVLNSGDIVKIVKSSPELDYEIFPVGVVVDDNTLILSGNVSHTSAGMTIEKVTVPNEAFKYYQGPVSPGVVRYYDDNDTAHDTYKTLALKIVLLSDTTYQVPMVSDVRAVAVSI